MADTTPKPAPATKTVRSSHWPLLATTETPRGRRLAWDYFSIPPELSGHDAAGEHMALLAVQAVTAACGDARRAHFVAWELGETTRAAARIVGSSDDRAMVRVATRYLRTLHAVLVGAIPHINAVEFVQAQVEAAERDADVMRNYEAQLKAARVERMAKARHARALDAWFRVEPRPAHPDQV